MLSRSLLEWMLFNENKLCRPFFGWGRSTGDYIIRPNFNAKLGHFDYKKSVNCELTNAPLELRTRPGQPLFFWLNSVFLKVSFSSDLKTCYSQWTVYSAPLSNVSKHERFSENHQIGTLMILDRQKTIRTESCWYHDDTEIILAMMLNVL